MCRTAPTTMLIFRIWTAKPGVKYCIYKVVQIWPGHMRLVYTQISPGHIWTTLYLQILKIQSTVTDKTYFSSLTVKDRYVFIHFYSRFPQLFNRCVCVCIHKCMLFLATLLLTQHLKQNSHSVFPNSTHTHTHTHTHKYIYIYIYIYKILCTC